MVHKLIPILITLLLFLVIFVVSNTIPEQQIVAVLENSGVFAPIVFICVSLITYVVAPLSGSPILFVGYKLFGDSVVFLTTIAAFISFIINFWLARLYGRPLLKKIIGEDGVNEIDRVSMHYGLVSLFFLRIFQGSIHDFISLAAGLTAVKFLPYIMVSAIAIIPGTALWYFVAQQVQSPLAFTLLSLMLTGVFSVLFLVGQWLYRLIR